MDAATVAHEKSIVPSLELDQNPKTTRQRKPTTSRAGQGTVKTKNKVPNRPDKKPEDYKTVDAKNMYDL